MRFRIPQMYLDISYFKRYLSYYNLLKYNKSFFKNNIFMNNNAGFANQLRSALSLKSFGIDPIIDLRLNEDLKIENYHKVRINNFFNINLVKSKKYHINYYYDSICIPYLKDDINQKLIFNLLNFGGMIDPRGIIPCSKYFYFLKEFFWQLDPKLKYEKLNDDGLRIYIRDFERENLKFKPKINEQRFIYKDVNLSSLSITETIKYEISILIKLYKIDFVEIISAPNINNDIKKIIFDFCFINKINYRYSDNHSDEMSDFMTLMQSKYMIISKYSTFGHLAAILNSNLKYISSF